MNTDELRYFIEAAREQNLSKAAKTLGTTQSTLSHAIRRLEREFDCKLFARSGKNLKLTLQGRKFSERAADIIGDIHQLKEEVSSGSTPLIGHFKAAGTLGVPVQILTRALLQVRASSGSVLEITSQRSAEVIKKVASKELDFGLCFDPQPHPHVKLRPVALSQTVVVVKKGHPLLKLKKDQRLLALANYPWAHPRHLPGVVSCSEHPIFGKFLKQPKLRYVYDNYDVAAEMLSASESWALLPKAILSKYPKTLTSTLEEYRDPVGLVLVWHEDGDMGLMDLLHAELKKSSRLHGWES